MKISVSLITGTLGSMVGMSVESVSGFTLIISTLAFELLGFTEELLGNVVDEGV